MSKKLLIIPLLGALLLLAPQAAKAHTVLRDSISGTGAVLHITPDDDPIAGEQSSMFFGIQGTSLMHGQTTAQVTITDDKGQATSATSRVAESGVAADFTFPRQGLYTLALSVEQNGKKLYSFSQSQRVSRGLSNSAPVRAPVWAEAGLVASTVLGTGTIISMFIRRKIIANYSKW